MTYRSILTPNAVSYATKTTGYFVHHLIGPAWNAVGHVSGAAADVVKQIFGAIYQVVANVGDGASDLVCEQMVQGSCSILQRWSDVGGERSEFVAEVFETPNRWVEGTLGTICHETGKILQKEQSLSCMLVNFDF